jgi:hypothetical protein
VREGWLYDGLTAVRHQITVTHPPGELRIVETGETIATSDLRPIGDRATILFARSGWDGWRLGLAGPLPADWAADLPSQEHHGGILDRIGLLPAILGGAAIAAACIWLVAQTTPVLARLVPEHWEVAFGETLVGDFGGNACRTPAGQRALDDLARRLSPGNAPVRVSVVDLPLVNAVALPGRQVILFNGLIREADSPDEVAGVLGHEIGHVKKRHVMTALIRDFGLSLLIGGADGGTIASGLLTSRYSRDAEREADAEAIGALRTARISPAPTARFFGRMARQEQVFGGAVKALSYIGSHPVSTERERLFRRAVESRAAYSPALSSEQWVALRAICGKRVRPKKLDKDT